MSKYFESRELYDKCCGEFPAIKRKTFIAGGKEYIYTAQCMSCGNTIETKDKYFVLIEWNKSIRSVKQ